MSNVSRASLKVPLLPKSSSREPLSVDASSQGENKFRISQPRLNEFKLNIEKSLSISVIASSVGLVLSLSSVAAAVALFAFPALVMPFSVPTLLVIGAVGVLCIGIGEFKNYYNRQWQKEKWIPFTLTEKLNKGDHSIEFNKDIQGIKVTRTRHYAQPVQFDKSGVNLNLGLTSNLQTKVSTDKVSKYIKNEYVTINGSIGVGMPETVQERFGAIDSETAAMQFVIKMILMNVRNDINGDHKLLRDTINLIDTRFLNEGPFDGEVGMLTRHRKLIAAALNKVSDDPDPRSQSLRRKIDHVKFLKEYDKIKDILAINTTSSPESINLSSLKSFYVEFHSINLGPEKRGWSNPIKDRGRNGATDKKNVENLGNIIGVIETESKNFPLNAIQKFWLKELQNIYKQSKGTDGKDNVFISGEKAFHTQYLIAKLSNAVKIVSSSGCKSNKDRGTAEHIFETCLDVVLKLRIEEALKSEKPIEELIQTGELDVSVGGFKLKSDEEREAVKKILELMLSDAVTEANTGKPGNKNLAGLIPLIKMAYTNEDGTLDEDGYKAMIKRIEGDSGGMPT